MNEIDNNNIIVVKQSAHLPLNVDPYLGRKWVLNGINNCNWQTYIDAFDDSPTNSSIIRGITEYIYADGLIDEDADNENNAVFNVSKHISESDVKLICGDYKKFGGYAVEIIWNSARNIADKRPILVKYFKIFKLGLSINEEMEVDGYWYSFDWTRPGRFKPTLLPMYDGVYKGNDVEFLVVQQPSSNDFFSQPDYLSGLRYAQIEGELQNWAFNHLKNGFQGTVLLNVNGGRPASQDLENKFRADILNKLTGTNNSNKVIVSFNKNAEQAIDVINIPIVELNEQYLQMATDAREQLIAAHQASPIIFANAKEGGGLSNNADEIEMATKLIYRKVIKPMQRDLTNSLNYIFKDIECLTKDVNGVTKEHKIKLKFKDFSSFAGDERKDIKTENI